jgi:hypothetical protein
MPVKNCSGGIHPAAAGPARGRGFDPETTADNSPGSSLTGTGMIMSPSDGGADRPGDHQPAFEIKKKFNKKRGLWDGRGQT